MKHLLTMLAAIVLAVVTMQAQNIVTCSKQDALKAEAKKLTKLYGAENVENALKGEITDGMPEALFLKAFNTEPVKYEAEDCKAYNVYNDDILKPRKPNMSKPNPLYLVIVSGKKVVKIKPAEKNGRYKIKNGTVVY